MSDAATNPACSDATGSSVVTDHGSDTPGGTGAFERVLIANRGEIALRVIRAVKAAGLTAIAVYSDADADAPHVYAADDAYPIGPAVAAQSYLSMERLLEAARASQAQAIHPGYGFLSENDTFVAACEQAGLIFIGPDASAVRQMGNKAAARRLMHAANVPCVPGFDGDDGDDELLAREAAKVGFPLMLKAAAGGGGRGMRRVDVEADLARAMASARAEARAAFGADELIVERLVESGRHVEVQVLADAHGNIVHLAERDCSVQRRHQKVIEEAPSPAVDAPLRAAMGDAACRAARAVAYRGAGTVEFLLSADGTFHFLEMNTRIQVEHPVTEAITGVDLVDWQLRIARGDVLDFRQADVALNGHAVEARLYAENPGRRFLPSPGRVVSFHPASGAGIRTDAGVESGTAVTPHYDPMIAKIIAHGPDRASALRRLVRALEDTVCFGPQTNRAFLADMLEQPQFFAGDATTDLLDALPGPHAPGHAPPRADALAVYGALRHHLAFDATRCTPELRNFSGAGERLASHYRIVCQRQECRLTVLPRDGLQHGVERYEIRVDDAPVAVEILHVAADEAVVRIDAVQVRLRFLAERDATWHVQLGRHTWRFRPAPIGVRVRPGHAEGIVASTPGRVVEIMVANGDPITAGQVVAVIESMKMRHEIRAEGGGTAQTVHVTPDAQVADGDVLVTFAPPPTDPDTGDKP